MIDIINDNFNDLAKDYYKLQEEYEQLQQESNQLKEEIKKYINSSDFVYDELYKKREKLLEILGGERK